VALTLSDALRQALTKNTIEPIYVLKFEGIDKYFSAVPVKSIPRYDDENLFYDLPGLNYDKPFISPKSRDYVIAQESSRSISQQIEPDKAGGTSATAMTFKIVDFQQEMSAIVSPGFTLPEFLGIGCDVYFTVTDGTSFPEDSITVMHGTVEESSAGPGFVRVTIAHPQNLLRQDFLSPFKSKLTEPLEFRSKVIQNNRYITREPLGNPVYVEYIYGVSLSVSVSDTGSQYNIQVTIINGVTTAKDVRKAIQDYLDSNRLVEVKSFGSESLIQVPQASTVLGDSNYVAVESVEGFFDDNLDADFQSYIKVEDEILKVTSVDSVNNKIYFDNTITNRGLFNSVFGVLGDVGDTVESFYVFEGNALTLSLKMMMSQAEDTQAITDLWGTIPSIGLLQNSVFFAGVDLSRDLGIVEGDFATMPGVFTERIVEQIVISGADSYMIVGGADIGTGNIEKTVSFKSKFNTLPVGCGIKSKFIDVPQFEALLERYSSDIPDYRFFIDDSIDMKEFLESEIFFPASLYLIPRKGRISVTITRPATGEENLFIFDSDVVTNPQNIEIGRSINRYFYNSIKWYYNRDSIDSDNYLDKSITINADSVQRFKRGVVPLLIESNGLRPDLGADQLIERNTRRMIDRYKNAPEYLSVSVPLAIGIPIEIGDTVVFGDELTQITDTTQGNRNFQPRLFEIINKTQNETDCQFTLLETAYGVNGRYGVIAPSSYVSSGATTTAIRLKKSFATGALDLEVEKWEPYVGQKVVIHNDDWTFVEETTIQSILGDNTGFLVAPALSSIAEDYIAEPASYSDVKNDTGWTKWKAIHCFFNPQVEILAGISATQFTVNVADQSKFLAGAVVRIHNFSYSIDSGTSDYVIDSVVGNLITLKKALPFIPASGQFVDLIGFKDGGKPYLYV
jgi:hypothetical protein